jgi:hypothetical protein
VIGAVNMIAQSDTVDMVMQQAKASEKFSSSKNTSGGSGNAPNDPDDKDLKKTEKQIKIKNFFLVKEPLEHIKN